MPSAGTPPDVAGSVSGVTYADPGQRPGSGEVRRDEQAVVRVRGSGLDRRDAGARGVPARQIVKASTILPPSAQIVADYFDIGDTRALPWPRRPETGRLLRELRSGTNTWNAIVVGEFTRAFGAPIQYSTTYPLLQHFGIELWLPEIGGRVDFSSATTEMLLGMLGARRSKNAT
jgi:DNA invertase Pin-like site-specific DNA recombinase